MEPQKPPSLSVISEKIFSQPIYANLISCCPTMDLVAVVTKEQRVDVYRFGGQRAFGLQRRNKDARVHSLCWKYNGQYLAVSWSDDSVDILSAETGISLQHFGQVTNSASDKPPSEEAGSEPRHVSCLGWGLNLIDIDAAKHRTHHPNGDFTSGDFTTDPTGNSWSGKRNLISLDDFLDRDPDLQAIDIPVDLPDQISQLDVADLMPKLPALHSLPASAYRASGIQPPSDLFSSQVSLDAALHKGVFRELNALNSFLLSDPEGRIRLIFYDSLSIGTVSFPENWGLRVNKHMLHASHPFSQSHVLLSEVSVGSKSSKRKSSASTAADGTSLTRSTSKIALTSLSLRFLQWAGKNIHFIDFKTAQLETLVQYVGECLVSLNHHWKYGRDLPSKFQRNISETLAEKGEPTLVQSLFHLAATGNCSAPVKEWLSDELTERGHKRWDHSVTQGYTKTIEITQECLIPALDRCNIVLNSLKGLAQYHEHSPVFDVSVSTLSLIIETVRCIRLLAHHILLYAGEEQRRFHIFSKWLRHMIDVQSTDPTSASADELAERDIGTDYQLLFAYIQGALEKSQIDSFICSFAEAPEIRADSSMYEDLKAAIEPFKQGKIPDHDLLKLSSYYKDWCRQNTSLVDQITSWQRANSLMPGGLVLEESKVSTCDMRMVFEWIDSRDDLTTYVALVPENNSNELRLHRVVHSPLFDDIPKSIHTSEAIAIRFVKSKIVDLKFIDDNHLMLLLEKDGAYHLIKLPYRPSGSGSDGVMEYRSRIDDLADMILPSGTAIAFSGGWEIEDLQQVAEHVIHTFQPSEIFRPAKLEVNGRKNRRTCIVLGDDERWIKIFDLEFSDEEARTLAAEEFRLKSGLGDVDQPMTG